jgi:hypothetical protein
MMAPVDPDALVNRETLIILPPDGSPGHVLRISKIKSVTGTNATPQRTNAHPPGLLVVVFPSKIACKPVFPLLMTVILPPTFVTK